MYTKRRNNWLLALVCVGDLFGGTVSCCSALCLVFPWKLWKWELVSGWIHSSGREQVTQRNPLAALINNDFKIVFLKIARICKIVSLTEKKNNQNQRWCVAHAHNEAMLYQRCVLILESPTPNCFPFKGGHTSKAELPLWSAEGGIVFSSQIQIYPDWKRQTDLTVILVEHLLAIFTLEQNFEECVELKYSALKNPLT